jgi:hypothetical protein
LIVVKVMLSKCQYIHYNNGMMLMAKPIEKQDRLMQMRVSKEFLRDVDEWRRKQPDIPSRAPGTGQAIRVDQGALGGCPGRC